MKRAQTPCDVKSAAFEEKVALEVLRRRTTATTKLPSVCTQPPKNIKQLPRVPKSTPSRRFLTPVPRPCTSIESRPYSTISFRTATPGTNFDGTLGGTMTTVASTRRAKTPFSSAVDFEETLPSLRLARYLHNPSTSLEAAMEILRDECEFKDFSMLALPPMEFEMFAYALEKKRGVVSVNFQGATIPNGKEALLLRALRNNPTPVQECILNGANVAANVVVSQQLQEVCQQHQADVERAAQEKVDASKALFEENKKQSTRRSAKFLFARWSEGRASLAAKEAKERRAILTTAFRFAKEWAENAAADRGLKEMEAKMAGDFSAKENAARSTLLAKELAVYLAILQHRWKVERQM